MNKYVAHIEKRAGMKAIAKKFGRPSLKGVTNPNAPTSAKARLAAAAKKKDNPILNKALENAGAMAA